jgi:hypothetical protein
MPENEPYDWADDDSMSAEETMRRFESLNPVPTTGPSERAENIPTPNELMPRVQTFASAATSTRVYPYLDIPVETGAPANA